MHSKKNKKSKEQRNIPRPSAPSLKTQKKKRGEKTEFFIMRAYYQKQKKGDSQKRARVRGAKESCGGGKRSLRKPIAAFKKTGKNRKNKDAGKAVDVHKRQAHQTPPHRAAERPWKKDKTNEGWGFSGVCERGQVGQSGGTRGSASKRQGGGGTLSPKHQEVVIVRKKKYIEGSKKQGRGTLASGKRKKWKKTLWAFKNN